MAVLLLFVAPMVSKTLMERQDQDRMLAMPQPGMVMSGSAAMHHTDMMMDMTMPGMRHHHMDDEEFACGYCALLIHVPLIVWVFIPLIWLVLVIFRTPPLPRLRAAIVTRSGSTYRPRAPPAVLIC